MGGTGALRAACVASLLTLAAAGTASAATITEFPIESGAPAGKHLPMYIAVAPDKTLWFTDVGTAAAVRHITTAGDSLGERTDARPNADIGVNSAGMVAWTFDTAPDTLGRTQTGTARLFPAGNVANSSVWGNQGYAVGFLPSGEYRYTAHVTEPALPQEQGFTVCRPTNEDDECINNTPASTRLTDLTLDSAGRLWALQPEGDTARRLNADATAFDLAVPLPTGSHPGRAALGPDGNLWLAGYGDTDGNGSTANRIIRLTPDGVQASFVLPRGLGANDIAAGPDGALWFTVYRGQAIGRITTSGDFTSYTLATAASKPGPYAIVAGPDGALWFTEREGGQVGRLVPGGAGTSGTEIKITPDVSPTLGALRLSTTTFAAARSGAAFVSRHVKHHKPPVGTRVSFSVSERSSVRFTVEQKTTGRTVGRRCVAKKRSNAKKHRCTRWVRVKGSFTVAGKAGKNSFKFRGRIGGKALRVGSYRLDAQATDPAKNVSLPRQKGFRIVR